MMCEVGNLIITKRVRIRLKNDITDVTDDL